MIHSTKLSVSVSKKEGELLVLYDQSADFNFIVAQGLEPAGEVLAYSIGRCLTYGIIQGISIVFIYPMEFTPDSPCLNQQREYSPLPAMAYFNFARTLCDHNEFLMLGKMLRPYQLDCDSISLPFKRSASERFEMNMPAVQQGVFEAPDGRIGIILANPTTEKQACKLYLPSQFRIPHGIHWLHLMS
jgi:hypothetical protein